MNRQARELEAAYFGKTASPVVYSKKIPSCQAQIVVRDRVNFPSRGRTVAEGTVFLSFDRGGSVHANFQATFDNTKPGKYDVRFDNLGTAEEGAFMDVFRIVTNHYKMWEAM